MAIDYAAVRGGIAIVIDAYNGQRPEGSPELKPMKLHDFRRVFSTDLLDNGVPIQAVARLLGHTSLQTTSIYDHTDFKFAAKAMLTAHRRLAGRVPCPHCDGTGTLSSPEGDPM